MLHCSQPVSNRDELPEEKGASLQLRNLIRQRHAEWSDATFGDAGPVGPLKHLSKEALEAAATPSDPLEWADMQFLLWDAQRRMGISDEFITRAMIEKLAINKARQWPEPKDGEPRLHIKEKPALAVTDSENGLMPCPFCGGKAHQLTIEQDDDPHFGGDVITCTECGASSHVEFGFKENLKSAWNSRAAMLHAGNDSTNGKALTNCDTVANSPVITDGWISCSERMPAQDDWVLIYSKYGEYLAGQVQGKYVELNDGTLSWLGAALHWMPLPEPPQQ
ncbi:restriction alleviation protein, Lar family [Salmonella enterica]|nr:restriction alleviation protein, Lar family [Salmonella enterica]